MSLLSVIVFIIILILSTVKSTEDNEQGPTLLMQNFREFLTKTIKDQSKKLQVLLKKVQINAQSVLSKIRNMGQNTNAVNYQVRDNIESKFSNEEHQIEAPATENRVKSDTSIELISNSRSFNNHYATSGYGGNGNANYGVSTYHHHSIGFDPINIVVSMSLLSFLLQALQGFLTRTRFPTPVVEAKSLNTMKNWLNELEKMSWKPEKTNEYLKKRFYKKYLG